MAKFGAVFNSDVKKTDNRPRSETKWIHYTKLIDNTDQYRKSATEDDIAAFAELIKSAGRFFRIYWSEKAELTHMKSLQVITEDLPAGIW